MHAVTIVEGQLRWNEHSDPEPGTGEVLVAVRAAGLNGADMMQRRGLYPAPPGSPAAIPGLEMAGEVIATGPGCERLETGDRVMAVVGGGGQAERCVVHERAALRVPESLSWPEAGGFPEVFTTAHDALFTQCELAPGESLLVHGAAGGVGIAAVQLGAQVGARVVASVRNEKLHDGVRGIGSACGDVEVVAPDDAFARAPFDVILELVGAPNVPGNMNALATGGRVSVIGIGAGAKAELDLLALMSKRASVRGSTLRARPLEQKIDAARRVETQVVPLLARGVVRVPVDRTFPFSEAEAAYDYFAAGGKLGKLVLLR